MVKIFLLDDKNYGKRIQEALTQEAYELNVFNNLKELSDAILLSKPQLILIPACEAIRYPRKLKKLLTVFSFIPIATYGEFGKNIKQSNKNIHKLLSKGYAACVTVQTILNKELLLAQIKQLISQALSKEDIWQKEYSISLSEVRNNFYRNLIA
ncbi:MAG: hypothetical protein QME68_09010, partial [Elusimicrobiota bacterium]|nr:hypothetical protein [Elusimicrobiota bacterium]